MLTAVSQIFVFLMGGFLVATFVFIGIPSFLEANLHVIIPRVIGDVIGMFCSVPVVANANLTDIWSFFIALETSICVGLALGFAAGLALG